ncbi:rod shape-determining protein MreC [Fructilactobacillus fructivorans]|uniref:Cell shape-determining protein MreC n=1 Tax=Fructilactobacillus fructivorans TaxID=1614 RepID=A0AAE6P0J5_9LACO|nr:rod shape-determining protein MreC [Fructilactobacillus fructivorans]KRK57842.1 rod shape-determining protein MreC [Fructilactobacillus fructivorans]KRN40720.1 rod shape-determining protein MreC [Fructilactobacillus fructivorans]KRN42399.1 rod shape-determining protein MreC [Fructilactobacillus fructivorans]QFX92886.1 rod shape-determining protein MreC [Fructilactobacillus fructivorans]RDV65515.1 rod shape-determining protein MreC [Fructilactobacillus fructivorans]
MHKFFSSRKLVIIVVCLIIGLGLISGSVAVRKNRATPPLIQQVGNDVVGFGDRIVSLSANGVGSLFGATGNLLNTYQENNHLKGQVEQLAQTQVKNQALENENTKLRQQLDIKGTPTDYKSINASVITRTPSSWLNQLIINKGSASGVQKNMSVIVNSGLVGRVAEVNKTNSKVELITDKGDNASRFSVQVQGQKKVVNGLIDGYNRDTNELVMGSVTNQDKIKTGTKVMTNGLGGVTPKGLFVGKVAGTKQNSDGISEKVNIKPAANMDDIEAVTVIGKKD